MIQARGSGPADVRLTGEPNRVAVVDFPWKFDDKLPGDSRGAAKNYRDMTIADGLAFDFRDRMNMAEDSLLFMWKVSAMPREVLDLIEAWGYKVHSELVWQKLTKTGKDWFGMGRIVRGSHESALIATRGDFDVEHSHESCVIARRGRPTILSKSIRSTFRAPVVYRSDDPGRVWHSAKPDEFYAIVEQLADGPRVDLFARKHRAGWTCVGDELTPADVVGPSDPEVTEDLDDPSTW